MKFDEVDFEPIEDLMKVVAGAQATDPQDGGGCTDGCFDGGGCRYGCTEGGGCSTGCTSGGGCFKGCIF